MLSGRTVVGGIKVPVTVELTRPGNTDAYGANDVVSNSVSASTLMEFANLARVAGGSGYVVGARLSTDKKSITPRIRVHLFNASNPTVSVDNANYQEKYADVGKRLGFFDLPAMATAADTSNSDMSRAIDMGLRVPFVCADATKSVFALLETLDAFTPANGQKFSLSLVVEAD